MFHIFPWKLKTNAIVQDQYKMLQENLQTSFDLNMRLWRSLWRCYSKKEHCIRFWTLALCQFAKDCYKLLCYDFPITNNLQEMLPFFRTKFYIIVSLKDPSHGLTLLPLPTIVMIALAISTVWTSVWQYDSCASKHENLNKVLNIHMKKMKLLLLYHYYYYILSQFPTS